MNCNCKKCYTSETVPNNCCTSGECCFESMGIMTDPLSVKGTVPAGCACGGEPYENGCILAQIYFPNQVYRAGFAPENALCNGTMFPELVRMYK